MEEDIKILEEFIEAVGEEYEVAREKQALERIIKAFRELEERNSNLNESNNLKINKINKLEKENQSYRDYFGEPPCYDNAKYIPKSRIQAKIEELERKIDFLNSQLTKCYEIWEKLGTETEIDDNEELIFNLENLKDEAWAQRQVLTEITYGE